MTTNIHSINLPKIVQIVWRHHVDFGVCKNRPLLLAKGVYCFFVFYLVRYSLITIHSVKKNSTRTAVGVILNTLWWNAPMFYHLWCQTNAALMRTSTNNPLFSSNCTTWLIHVHPTWQRKTFLQFYTSFHLICNSAIYSGMWENM